MRWVFIFAVLIIIMKLIEVRVDVKSSRNGIHRHTRQSLCLTIKSKFPVYMKFTLTFKLNVPHTSHLLGFSLLSSYSLVLLATHSKLCKLRLHSFISRKRHILFICDYYCFIIVVVDVVVQLFCIILPQTVDHHHTQLFSPSVGIYGIEN